MFSAVYSCIYGNRTVQCIHQFVQSEIETDGLGDGIAIVWLYDAECNPIPPPPTKRFTLGAR
jgi:hypothetical protein